MQDSENYQDQQETVDNSLPRFRNFRTSNEESNKARFASNIVQTAKYTAISYIPAALLTQFKLVSTIYFFVIAIIQCIPFFSSLDPFSAISPFILVLCLSVAREGFEDLEKRKKDLELNSLNTFKYVGGVWKEVDWKDVYVGDFIKVMENHFLPADIIPISCSNLSGTLFIQTSGLDGEMNLKRRKTVSQLQDDIGDGELIRVVVDVTIPIPDPDLYNFYGKITTWKGKNILLSQENFAPRESMLKNTEWVIGIVAYTGSDTKITQSLEESDNKISNMEKMVQSCIITVLAFQVIVSLLMGFFSGFWVQANRERHSRFVDFGITTEPLLAIMIGFASSLVLTSTMIPISMIITLEMVKIIQSYFISSDIDLHSVQKDRNASVFSSNLNEDLGQIDHIFIDKTGTLTSNQMEFKHCLVGDTLYGDASIYNDGLFANDTNSKYQTLDDIDDAEIPFNFEDKRLASLEDGLVDDKVIDMKISEPLTANSFIQITSQGELVQEFFTILALCHNCEVYKTSEGKKYRGHSADEVTLVDAASRLGFSFESDCSRYRTAIILGEKKHFEVIQIFPFNSERRKSSVIIHQDGYYKLMVKGADDSIYQRLTKSTVQNPNAAQQEIIEDAYDTIDILSDNGMRNLVVAERLMNPYEVQEVQRRIKKAIEDDRRDLISTLTIS